MLQEFALSALLVRESNSTIALTTVGFPGNSAIAQSLISDPQWRLAEELSQIEHSKAIDGVRELPNADSIRFGRKLINRAAAIHTASSFLPTPDGGLALFLQTGDRLAQIERYNDEEIIAWIFSARAGVRETWAISEEDELEASFSKMEAFLGE